MFEKEIEKLLKKHVKGEITLEVPPNRELGDYAFPCFSLAKELKKSPNEIANGLMQKIKTDNVIEHVEANGSYVNFFINKEKLAERVLSGINQKKENYGSSDLGGGKTIVMDFSHPNIAKPFGIGHLRSTVIGNAIYLLHKFSGYKVIRVNHLGDWGTQFGSLIYAYDKWGDEKKLEKEPINHLLDLYVKFHKQAEKNKKLQAEARKWFKKLEDGDKKAVNLWTRFRELSLGEFQKIYKLLKIEFDSYDGEAFYINKLDKALKASKKFSEMSEGALVINLEKHGIPPLILKKSDEASTYALRDLTAIMYRMKTYKPEKILYIVGSEQKLYFQQVFKAAELLGYGAEKLIHIPFGLYRFEKEKMSTRKGKVIFMEDVLNKSIALAKKTIQKKNPKLEEKEQIAAIVGIGAVIFGDLINDRVKDIDFDWDKMLDFEGDTSPYLQYTYARASSILKKISLVKPEKVNFALLKEKEEIKIMFSLMDFPKKINESLNSYKPHILAHHLIELARNFNEFYQKHPVIYAESRDLQKSRLMLVNCTRQVIKNGLSLLGITVPEEM